MIEYKIIFNMNKNNNVQLTKFITINYKKIFLKNNKSNQIIM